MVQSQTDLLKCQGQRNQTHPGEHIAQQQNHGEGYFLAQISFISGRDEILNRPSEVYIIQGIESFGRKAVSSVTSASSH